MSSSSERYEEAAYAAATTIQGFRLSPQQERLWRLTGGTAGRAACAVLLRGGLDLDALRHALERVVARHEILRTSFLLLPGMAIPLQVISEEAIFELAWIESGMEAEGDGAHWVERLLAQVHAERPGVPLVCAATRLAPSSYGLALGLSALSTDRRSLQNLVEEIGRSLGSLTWEPVGELTQYADYSEWQNEVLKSEVGEGKKPWVSLLQDPDLLELTLPFDPVPTADRDASSPRRVSLKLGSTELLDRLDAVARLSRADASTVLLTAWSALLGRLSGGRALAMGIHLAGRRYEELERSQGLFARWLPIACDFQDHVSFAGAIESVAAKARDLEQWQDLFDWKDLADWSGEGDPILPVGFACEEQPPGFETGGLGWTIEESWVPGSGSRLDLSCLRLRGGEGLVVDLVHHPAVLRREDAERMVDWFGVLLRHALAEPQRRIADLELLSPAERRQILVLNATDADLGASGTATIAELFAVQAGRTPERIALLYEDRSLTFEELDRRSTDLARNLAGLGVGPETPVALAVERSFEMVIGLLAILKAGGAYVPLDPEYPRDRLAYMLDDSRALLLLTQQRLLESLPAFSGRVLCIDGAPAERNEEARRASPDNLAYVIYTSGSTGRPKGVMVSHRAILNRLLWMQRTFPLGPDDILLQKTPYSFDASIWEIFLPLLTGVRLVLAIPGGQRDNAYLKQAIAQNQVTVLQLVPSHLSVFLQQEGVPAACRSLRRVFCGGEALPWELAQRCLRSLDVELCNLYGPTEAAIDTTFEVCAPERRSGSFSSLPIGLPLANVQVYLLDSRHQLAPPGLPGELYIGGTGLARGYFGQVELTAQRFLPHPWSARPGERLYRTGDLARHLPDGRIEFLGRVDAQLKIRGFRIEPGEIESTLLGHPVVREVVVVPRASAQGGTRLIAYVVLEDGAGESVAGEDLRRFLAQRLPEYMLPGATVLLGALPRLPNGKLDRAGLPEPGEAQGRKDPNGDTAKTATEEMLTGIWCELLPVAVIGCHDNFFDLGGHSLLATQVVSRARELFQVELRVHHLFEAPTVSALGIVIDTLMRERSRVELPPIEPVPRGGELPLSFGQQRLWFLDRLDPGSVAYNLPVAVRLRGRLSVPVLSAGLNELVRRHEALRTTFPQSEKDPFQVIAAAAEIHLPVVDLTALPSGMGEQEGARLRHEVAFQPFDLARGPLLRAALLRLASEDHVAVLSMHHIAGDGWSTSILVRELAVLCEAFGRGFPSPLAELPLQYADYAVWQRRYLTGETMDTLLGYWRRQLEGDLPTLRLPLDRPRSSTPSTGLSALAVFLPVPLVETLKDLGRRNGCSFFMTLLTGFDLLLAHSTGQRDLLVATPIANRNRTEVEGIVGPFVNSLLLRTRLSGDPSLGEVLNQVRDVTLGGYVHQEMPFDRLVNELQAERSGQQLPLFETMFMLHNLPPASFELTGLQVRSESLANHTAKFDLLIELYETGEGLRCGLEYRTALFDATTMSRFADHLVNTLRELAADPGRRISQLSPLGEAERHQLVCEWNDTAAPYPGERCLQELFEEQAKRDPDAVAVICGTAVWTYGELDRRANQLAHRLKSLGVGPGSLVAVYLERGLEMVQALYGILKAGGAYVPLEVGHPPARVAELLSGLGIEVAVTAGAWVGPLANLVGAPRLRHMVCLIDAEVDAEPLAGRLLWTAAGLSSLPEVPPAPPAMSDDLAYIIFTSGSTGTPKGVMVRHRPVINLIHWITGRFQVGASERMLMVASLSFDLSVYDIFGLLAVGGSVRVASAAEVADPEALVRILLTEPITFWDSAPAALQQLVPFLPADPQEASHRLRRVFLSGDWVPLPLPGQMRRAFPNAEVIALGGATEATVWSNFYPVARIEPHWVSVPYGRPIANARYHVLDEHLSPCSIGVEGDLYIAGDCLFSGYTVNARENAVKNLPDPYSERPGARMYRTGDRARFFADGNLEFLGRRDHQVKIRGFRIELGEIEAALVSHAAVAAAVAVVREDAPGDRRLTAYVVPAAGEEAPTARDLREFLRQRLPEYMLPAAVVTIEELPVTANGKLDRSRLPAPGALPAAGGAEKLAPRDTNEKLLAAIWAEVLGIREIGVHDNFFELGGDSILGIQIVTRARLEGLSFQPRDIFDHQTIAELAALCRHSTVAQDATSSAEGTVPLLPAQRWLLERRLPEIHHFNQAVFLAVSERLDDDLLSRAVGHLLAHHAVLRSRFTQTGEGEWRQAIAPLTGLPPSGRVDLGGLAERRRELEIPAVLASLQSSIDLADGPLLRAAVIDLGDGTAQHLLLLAHHLVVDGVSWRILLDDLFNAYQQLANGGEPSLPAATSTLGTWVASLRRFAGSEPARAERAYWTALARKPLPGLLPIDRLGDGAGTVATARSVTWALDPSETQILLREVPRHRVQIQEILLTALLCAYADWTGRADLLVDVEGHGRQPLDRETDVSRTVGWLTAFYPVRLAMTGPRQPEAALKAVKEILRRVPNGGLGYGSLRYFGDPETAAEIAALPPAQILFNYLGQLDQALPGSHPVAPAQLPTGPLAGSSQPRSHPLEVNASVAGGRLHLAITYSESVHQRATIERVGDRIREHLTALIQYCRNAGSPVYTPADFPLADLDQTALDRLVKKFPDLEDVYPLSPLQEGLLFFSLDPATAGIYQQQLSCSLHGDIDPADFASAWRQLVARHSILRTAFLWEEVDRPLQVVHRRVDMPVTTLDWSGLGEGEWSPRLELLRQQGRRNLLAVGAAPLMRLTLVRLPGGEFHFIWDYHHLVLDGWSGTRLIQELFTLYSSLRQHAETPLPVVRPYRDYIAWLARQDRGEAEAFWRHELAGFAGMPPAGGHSWRVPAESAATAAAVESLLELRTTLPAPDSAAARAWTQRNKLTLATLLHGAWALLLGRLGGLEDVVFGTVTAGRPADLEGLEERVGVFINTLPARVRIEPASSPGDWLRSLQRRHAESRRYEHCSLGQVQAWSELPAGRPLFDTLIVFENFPVVRQVRGAGAGAVDVRSADFVSRTNYALTLIAAPESALPLWLQFDARRFDPADAERLLSQLKNLLTGLIRQDARSLDDVSLLGEAERQQLLREWNDTATPGRTWRGVHELFASRAALQPTDWAVIGTDERLSYAELDRRAESLAGELRALGVGPEARVGVLLERSSSLVAAILAVLKAGGAYLPLDPSYPRERLAWMVGDARPVVVLTQERLRPLLPWSPGAMLVLDAVREVAQRPAPPPLEVQPDNLAYVIYTSGSTGRPKAAMISHGGLANYLRWALATYSAEAAGALSPLHSSISFDLTVTSLFVPLLSGGSVVLTAESEGVEGLSEALHDGATSGVVKLTPSHLRVLAEGLRPEDVEGWSGVMVIGGEALRAENLGFWRSHAPRMRLFNEYGPTETVVGCTIFEVSPIAADAALQGAVPIGRPAANTCVRLLDAAAKPLPVGVVGELYIGGEQVCRGYLGRPELTAERFVPDPFAETPGTRLYRTGDLALYRPDGTIEFLGRVDSQVKIRGFRIELGEIEAALASHPAVGEAVASVREDEPGDRRLVAYAVVRRGALPPAVEELREHLKISLPEHMLPAAIVIMEELPVTPNGKVDRARLPGPGSSGRAKAGESSSSERPWSVAEMALAEVWRDVLRVDRVGLDDRFLDLGGDSILSLQVASRARRAGLRLKGRDVFDHPTLAELAAVAEGRRADANPTGLVAVGAVPLTPIQQWFFAGPRLDPHHFNQSLLLTVAEPLQVPALRRAVQAVTDHHDALRLRFERRGGSWHQEHGTQGAPLEIPHLDLTSLPTATRARALECAATELQSSFDLGRGSLLRMILFELGGEARQRLFLAAHHLVVDAVSWRILLEDLEATYRQAVVGESPRLPARTSSFQSWAARLVEEERSPALAVEADYWLAMAQAEVRPLPVDSVGGEGRLRTSDTVRVALGRDATSDLLERAHRAYQTHIDDLLLTALAEAFGRWTGERRLLLQLEKHGRDDLGPDFDLSRTVGWFTSLFPVLLSLPEPAAPEATIPAVREQLRAVPRGGLGFGLLRYGSGHPEVARRLAAAPAPQVLFNHLGQLDQGLAKNSLFAAARERSGPSQSPREVRLHLVEIIVYVADGQLQVAWTFSPEVHDRSTMERLAADYLEALEALIAHCLAVLEGDRPAPLPPAGSIQEDPYRILPVRRDDPLPLSFAQQRLWFLDQLDPGQATLNIPIALRLRGELRLPELHGALSATVRRHETLRTTFRAVEGVPCQVIAPPAPPPLPVVALTGLPADLREAEARRLTDREARRPFDLEWGPLLRLHLLELAKGEHILLLTLHHILSDAWSAGVLVAEVTELYTAACAGRVPALRDLPVQYADFAVWQRHRLTGAVLEEHLAYWRRQLAGELPVTTLPADRPHLENPSSRGANLTLELPAELADGLRALARGENATLFMVLLAAFAVLLRHLTTADDLVVGTDVANRDDLEAEGMIGFFVNQLALRLRLPGSPGFRELLGHVREVTLEAYAHQDLPFERLVDALGIDRGVTYSPLFRTKLFVTHAPPPMERPQGLSVQPFEVYAGTAQLDFMLSFRDAREGLLGGVANFRTDLYEPATVAGFLASYVSLLQVIVAQPATRLDELEAFLADRRREQRAMEKTQRSLRDLQKFKAVKPRPVEAVQGELVKLGQLHPGQTLPLLVEPAVEGMDLADWAAHHRSFLESRLHEHGAILFRGFDIDNPPALERFAAAVCSELFNENGEHPRESVSGNVYTPVFYPRDQRLLLHNENSFNQRWPRKILFACATPPESGGETPLVDSRAVYQRLGPDLRRQFEERRVLYMRNYGYEGIGLPWQDVFQTDDPAEVERKCREAAVQWEWRGAALLRTLAVRPAVIEHPVTREKVWFNQAQHWHVSCLDPEIRASMESLFAPQDLPRNCFFGDGSPIEDETMREILRVYDELEVSFPWQRGDVLLVDNLMTAHGRNPFTGERKILVALGDMDGFEEVSMDAAARMQER